jgi:hypothetical protein
MDNTASIDEHFVSKRKGARASAIRPLDKDHY